MFIYIDIFPPTGVKVLSGQDAVFPVGITETLKVSDLCCARD